jgi:hypothetical protein
VARPQAAELPWKEKGFGFALPSLKLPDFAGGFDSLAEDFKASHVHVLHQQRAGVWPRCCASAAAPHGTDVLLTPAKCVHYSLSRWESKTVRILHRLLTWTSI